MRDRRDGPLSWVVERRRFPVDGTDEEMTLIRKLVITLHLNVTERRRLPNGRAKASMLLVS